MQTEIDIYNLHPNQQTNNEEKIYNQLIEQANGCSDYVYQYIVPIYTCFVSLKRIPL